MGYSTGGGSGAGASTLDKAPSDITIGNTAVETDFYRKTITAGTLGATGGLRFRLVYDFLNTTATPTLTMKIKFGSTTLFAVAAGAFGANANHSVGYIDFVLLNVNASSQRVGGVWTQSAPGGTAATNGTGPAGTTLGTFVHLWGTSAENSAVDADLAVTMKWSAADAGSIVVRKLAVLEQI
jgi:hypothetical protein